VLGELAQDIVDYLNSLADSTWTTTYKLPAKLALDPSVLWSEKTKNLWVLPVVTSYATDAGEVNRRGQKINQIAASVVIDVVISMPFTSFNILDVASPAEVKKVLLLRETVDLLIMRNTWGDWTLEPVESEPPQEIELNERWFLSVTEYTFNKFICG